VEALLLPVLAILLRMVRDCWFPEGQHGGCRCVDSASPKVIWILKCSRLPFLSLPFGGHRTQSYRVNGMAGYCLPRPASILASVLYDWLA
jgi:hypothetical protein